MNDKRFFRAFPTIEIPPEFSDHLWEDVSYSNDAEPRLERRAKTLSGATITVWVYDESLWNPGDFEGDPRDQSKFTIEWTPADKDETKTEFYLANTALEALRFIGELSVR